MRHYTARVRCPKCGFEFTVCIHSVRRPELKRSYLVLCPANASKVHIPDSALTAVEACPRGAIVIQEPR